MDEIPWGTKPVTLPSTCLNEQQAVAIPPTPLCRASGEGGGSRTRIHYDNELPPPSQLSKALSYVRLRLRRA